MGVFDVLFIVACSVFSSLLSELVSYLLVYRTESYQKACARIKVLNVKYLHSVGESKKAQKYKTELKELGAHTSGGSIKTFLFLAVIQWLTFTALSRKYSGMVVAKLPFVPIGLVQGFSHRSIVGSDLTECSFFFIFMLSSVLRSTVQKVLVSRFFLQLMLFLSSQRSIGI